MDLPMSTRSFTRPCLPARSSVGGPATPQLSFRVQVPLHRSMDICVKVTRPSAHAGTEPPRSAPPARRDSRMAPRNRGRVEAACVLIATPFKQGSMWCCARSVSAVRGGATRTYTDSQGRKTPLLLRVRVSPCESLSVRAPPLQDHPFPL